MKIDPLLENRILREPEVHMTTDPLDRIMREPEVEHVTGLSRTTRWRMEKKGLFPPRRQISPNCSGNMESEIRAWLAERKASA